MRAKIKFLILYIIFIVNSILALVMLYNPEQRNWWKNPYYYQLKPPKPTTWSFRNGNIQKNLTTIPEPALHSIFRGDNQRTGFYRLDLDPKDLQIKFLSQGPINYGIHSASKASPAVNEDYIITTSDFGLLSLYKNNSTEQQKPIWTFMSYRAAQGFHSTPIIYGQNLIFADYSGTLYSLNMKSLKLNWLVVLGDSIGASPSIDRNGFLYVNVEREKPEGFIAKVNAITGEVVWTSEYFGEQSHSSSALNEDESLLIFGDNLGKINIIRTEDGELIKQLHTSGPIKTTPAVMNNIAYLASWDSNLYAVDLNKLDVIWQTNVNRPYLQSSFAVYSDFNQGVIYTSRGLCKFDLKTGQELGCFKTKYKSASGKSSPIITASKTNQNSIIWAACEYDYFCAIDFKTMKLIKKWQTFDGISGEAKIWNKYLYIVTEGEGGLIQL